MLTENKREGIIRIQDKSIKQFWGKIQDSVRINIETDELAATLMPSDLQVQNLRPLKTTGKGDCLFNAASLFLKGKILNWSLEPSGSCYIVHSVNTVEIIISTRKSEF